MANSPPHVRPAVIDDVPLLYEMARRLAEEEGTLPHFTATEADWRRDGFGTGRRFLPLVAEAESAALGLLTYTELYSTGLARSALFIIDLYVRPEQRRRGVGRALLAHLAQAALRQGAPCVQLAVRNDNDAARLYGRSGFQRIRPFTFMALVEPALSALAACR